MRRWSYGLMQVVPLYWRDLIGRLAGRSFTTDDAAGQAMVADPLLAIRAGAAVLRDYQQAHGSWDAASSAFFTGTPNWNGQDSVNGTTGNQYKRAVDGLIAEIRAAQPVTTPTPTPARKPITEAQVLNLISNSAPGVYVSFGYAEANTVSIYHYGKGHMSARAQGNNIHPGIDIWMPDETPVNAVFAGEVICVGNRGEHVFGQGCGYFSDDDGGIGKISVLTERSVVVKGKARRMMMVYGHMSSSIVTPGQMVEDGQRIGRSGRGGQFPHIHLDVSVGEDHEGELNNPAIWNNPGRYHLLDPLPAIISAYGGDPLPITYAERIPVPQPSAWEDGPIVTITRAGVKIQQRASKDAAEVESPFNTGEQFKGVMLVYSEAEDDWYWVSRRGSRISIKGTSSDLLGER